MRIRKQRHLHHTPSTFEADIELYDHKSLSLEPKHSLSSLPSRIGVPNCSPTQPKQEIHQTQSNQHLIIRRGTNSWICSNDKEEQGKVLDKKSNDSMHLSPTAPTKDPIAGGEEEAGAEDNRSTETNGSDGRNWSAKACCEISISSQSSSSHQAGGTGRSCKAVKKRDESFNQTENEMKSSVKSNNERLFIEENGGDNKKKRIASDGAMMEGSRCSRVNGRGWRCSQQTLVGYSLCDHHLGKGRLASMKKKINVSSLSSSSLLSKERGEQATLVTANKRKKVRVVKARSMSSLLGITQPEPNTIKT